MQVLLNCSSGLHSSRGMITIECSRNDINSIEKIWYFQSSAGFQVGLPDASLVFGFDSSREAEVQNLKINVKWFLKVICLLLRIRHHFTHRYFPSLGRKHSVCWKITMRRLEVKKMLLTFRVKAEGPAAHLLGSCVETQPGIKATGLQVLSPFSAL